MTSIFLHSVQHISTVLRPRTVARPEYVFVCVDKGMFACVCVCWGWYVRGHVYKAIADRFHLSADSILWTYLAGAHEQTHKRILNRQHFRTHEWRRSKRDGCRTERKRAVRHTHTKKVPPIRSNAQSKTHTILYVRYIWLILLLYFQVVVAISHQRACVCAFVLVATRATFDDYDDIDDIDIDSVVIVASMCCCACSELRAPSLGWCDWFQWNWIA